MYVDVEFKDGYQCRFKHLYTCDWHYYYESDTAYYIVPCKDVLIARVSIEEAQRCMAEAKAIPKPNTIVWNEVKAKEKVTWKQIEPTSSWESEQKPR